MNKSSVLLVKIMIDKLYNDLTLTMEEKQYSHYFKQLQCIFPNPYYKIFVRSEDFARALVAGVVNTNSDVAVSIYLKYGSLPIDNPLNPIVLEEVKNHFSSGYSQDLVLNHPV